ncbi:MAG TPA: Fe-S oxidoreductase [Flavobacterium sp.]|nr:Fe-S oxidoreductase [Flavobacterium sp.]
MSLLDNILFAIILCIGIGYFAINVKKLIRNIKLGQKVDRVNNSAQRFKNMLLIAFGQSKMINRPVAGFLHILVYLGFIIINIEVLEIIIDGLFGTHRIFTFLGGFYYFLIASFEILAVLVLVSVFVFWTRRNVLHIKRFMSSDLSGAPKNDANIILYFEVVLMCLFLIMNATDTAFQTTNSGNVISQFIAPWFSSYSITTLHIIERTSWWLHICGILIFLNYLYYSKHLHILLAFPNTYFADLNVLGKLNNLESITNEVKSMMNLGAETQTSSTDAASVPSKFGASDVHDLNWVQLLNAYTCTECGRCTSACPANITGKKLSPRKIMMDTRDRLEEVGRNMDKNKGVFIQDNKSLLNDYISKEELWACTSCNACVEECPINISPLSIIIEMRRFLVMEQSAAPMSLNNMMANIENNGAPWQYNQQDRLNWKCEN